MSPSASTSEYSQKPVSRSSLPRVDMQAGGRTPFHNRRELKSQRNEDSEDLYSAEDLENEQTFNNQQQGSIPSASHQQPLRTKSHIGQEDPSPYDLDSMIEEEEEEVSDDEDNIEEENVQFSTPGASRSQAEKDILSELVVARFKLMNLDAALGKQNFWLAIVRKHSEYGFKRDRKWCGSCWRKMNPDVSIAEKKKNAGSGLLKKRQVGGNADRNGEDSVGDGLEAGMVADNRSRSVVRVDRPVSSAPHTQARSSVQYRPSSSRGSPAARTSRPKRNHDHLERDTESDLEDIEHDPISRKRQKSSLPQTTPLSENPLTIAMEKIAKLEADVADVKGEKARAEVSASHQDSDLDDLRKEAEAIQIRIRKTLAKKEKNEEKASHYGEMIKGKKAEIATLQQIVPLLGGN